MFKSLPNITPQITKVLFCGLVPDKESLMMQHHYANPRDKFWRVLHEVAFTEMQLKTGITQEARDYNYNYLMSKGIGLTDLGDDITALNNLVSDLKPKVLAFNGKKAAQRYWGLAASGGVRYGKQPLTIGNTMVFVLPSTSGAAIPASAPRGRRLGGVMQCAPPDSTPVWTA